MTNAEIVSAPRWRRMLAGLADVALAGGLAWLWRRWAASAAAAGRTRWTPFFGPAAELVREQLGSPGQHLLGVRTVDRRTGRRVGLWRTVVLLGAGAAAQLLARRLTPALQTPEQERERERFREELKELDDRQPAGSPDREAEMHALLERHPGPLTVNLWRSMGTPLATGVINSRLRRRLAPTTEILARRRPHRP